MLGRERVRICIMADDVEWRWVLHRGGPGSLAVATITRRTARAGKIGKEIAEGVYSDAVNYDTSLIGRRFNQRLVW